MQRAAQHLHGGIAALLKLSAPSAPFYTTRLKGRAGRIQHAGLAFPAQHRSCTFQTSSKVAAFLNPRGEAAVVRIGGAGRTNK